jgi:glyoxylase-like metal-dependent hydrolase (beta-lactamase superfamily II)
LTESLLKVGLIGEGHKPEPLTESQIAIDRLIAEGDAIAVDGATFTVLETPGHSDCSLSFHEPDRGILVISDATGFYVPEGYWWPCYFVDYGCYVSSIERLAGLRAKVLCLSHNGAVKGADAVRAYFDDALAATRAYHQRIVDEAKAGKGVREIAGALGAEVHARAGLLPVDFFQKNCALLVKASLAHEGIGEGG